MGTRQAGVSSTATSLGRIGLTQAEVAARVAAGAVNQSSGGTGRTVAQILRANLLTRFNAILGALFAVVLIVGPLQDALFGVVLVVNAAVGIAQELRAKRTLDGLALLSAPQAHAVRDGVSCDIPAGAVVVDDVLEIRPGDQLVVDGTVLDGDGLELDESLLSGESLPVRKLPGDAVLSGSAVLAGRGAMRVDRVGDEAFAQGVQKEARRFDLVRSELRNGINRILQLISWAMAPVTALLVTSQVARAGQPLGDAVRSSVAGIGAMVPEGLVLLTTIAFAVGAVRLARRRVLVQELAAIEGLARVDVLCIDKTGTLTEPGVRLAEVVSVSDGLVRDAVGAMAFWDPTPNATMLAARAALTAPPGWSVVGAVPFSSERKWSAMEFAGKGSWVMGAQDVTMPSLEQRFTTRIDALAAHGRRVLLVAHSPEPLRGQALPSGLECAGWLVFEEKLRPDAKETIAYLRSQGVRLMVLSGDDPRTVAHVARSVGIPGAGEPVDASSLPAGLDDLAHVLGSVSVIGRVRPYQKRDVVRALQRDGHVVAMTGDGVNDIPALKVADLGMAMGTGSAATRAVGRMVLLDSAFAVVPQILAEGRRVIANVQRVSRLFVTKTVYATILALVVGISALPYPFYPRHLTLVSSLAIGIPGFFLALAPGAPRARSAFLDSVLRFAVPAGVVAALATLAAYLVARDVWLASGLAARTAATGVLLAVSLAVLALVARPLGLVGTLVPLGMAAVAALAWIVPVGRTLFGLQAPPWESALACAGIALAAVPMVAIGVRLDRIDAPRGPHTPPWGRRPAPHNGAGHPRA